MDRKTFFDAVRRSVFKGTLAQGQVDGLTLILTEAEKRNVNNEYLANILATTAWETGRTMQPIHERGDRAYFNKYEPTTKIGKTLGNTKKGDGYLFRGRGYVQITGRANYEKATRYFREKLKIDVDFVANPELTLKPEYAVIILFAGMIEGWFTGKKLGDYLDGINGTDAEDRKQQTNARRVVNGTDKASTIADLALLFEAALRGSQRPDSFTTKTITIPVPQAAPDASVVFSGGFWALVVLGVRLTMKFLRR